jgi:hypothetical protein
MESGYQFMESEESRLLRRKVSRLVALNVRVPADVRKQLKVHAAANGLTMSELLIGVFREVGILRASSTGDGREGHAGVAD